MLEERVRGLAAVLEVVAVARALNDLTGERGPLLHNRIAGMPAAEDCPEIQLTQCVDPVTFP